MFTNSLELWAWGSKLTSKTPADLTSNRCLVRLKLLVGSFDSIFAYAMDAPNPINFGGFKTDVRIAGEVDIQRVYDDIMEVKVRLLDDAILCCVYGFRYLVTWRSFVLSALYLCGLLLCCWKTYLTWAIIPLLLAISLVVNSFPQARAYMTRGGLNAALTEEGFNHTAAWRDSGEVLTFINRVLKDDMKAILTDERSLDSPTGCNEFSQKKSQNPS